MEWWLLATLAAAGGPPYLATPDVGLGRGDGVPRLGAREVVRVLLPAALPFVVFDGHPPREARGVAVHDWHARFQLRALVCCGFRRSRFMGR